VSEERCSIAVLGCAVGLLAGAPGAASAAGVQDPGVLGVKAIKGIPAPVDGVVGVDGPVWSVSLDGRSLTRISTRTGRGGSAPLRTRGLQGLPGPAQIAVGSDGMLAIPVRSSRGWGVLRRSVDGVDRRVTWFPASVRVGPTGLSDLEAGPDGAVWFATSGTIGKVTPAGRVRAWRIPTAGGYPQADRPRLAAGVDGRMWFTALGGVGSISTSGTFGPWEQVATDPSIGLSLLVRGGDDRLWATGGPNDDRFYRRRPDGTWTTTGRYHTDLAPEWTTLFEALAPDPADGVLAIGAQQPEGSTTTTAEFFNRVGTERASWTPFVSGEAGPGGGFRTTFLGPPLWDDIADSPGRYAIVPLPDGRIWVSLRDWDGWESYEKQQGTRATLPRGKAMVRRVWRSGSTVQALVRCVGPTGGWCRTTLRAKVGREARRVTVVVPAAPTAVHASTTARVRLFRSQQAEVRRGRRISVRVGGEVRSLR
jgi:hypothetical protein